MTEFKIQENHPDLISVIMPAYNVEKYIAQAIQSVLDQTYANFELLIVDDASPDRSIEIARSFNDSRIKIITHDQNRGLAMARNTGASVARGGFLAFLDSDDVMVKDRLAIQKKFFDDNPEVSLCGGGYRTMSADGVLSGHDHSITIKQDAVNALLVFINPFNFSTVMMRRSAWPVDGFRHRFAEDYDFLSRAAAQVEMAIIPEIVAYYRIHSNSIMRTTGLKKKLNDRWETMQFLINKLGIVPTPQEKDAALLLSSKFKNPDFKEMENITKWCDKLTEANRQSKLFNECSFERAAAYAWFLLLNRATGQGLGAIRIFIGSKLSLKHGQPASRIAKFLIKSLFHRT